MKVMNINSLLTILLMETENPYVLVEPSIFRPPIIAFMGTRNIYDIFDNINVKPRLWPMKSHQRAPVHGGFARHTMKLLKTPDLQEFIQSYDEPIISGHSLGGAVATLVASQLYSDGKNVKSVHTFGAPRIASRKFLNSYNSQGLGSRTWRYVIEGDPVSKYSPFYMHLGNEVKFARVYQDFIRNHDLLTYQKKIKDDPHVDSWTVWP